MYDKEQEFLAAIRYVPSTERDDVERALQQVKTWHAGQFRHSGDPFVVHPIATALFLAQLECSAPTLIAGLLHDVVEDNCTTFDEVERLFGKEVRGLVDAVTKLTKLRYEGKRHERQIASLQKMLLAASEDLRVIVIKLADRLHNVETIGALPPDKQERIAHETLEIYAPFARMTGLWEVKRRFEEVCFPIAFAEEATAWRSQIMQRRAELAPLRDTFVRGVPETMSVTAEARLTPMTDYELFRKCDHSQERLRGSGVVDSVLILLRGADAQARACYEVLGALHGRYHSRHGGIRDFIGQPLPNGYQALHTVLFLAYDHQVLVRIQTETMEEYASRRKYSTWMTDRTNPLYRALAGVHGRESVPEQYIENLRANVLADRINVFTPAGDIVVLPRGATGIDLAAALDTSFLKHLAAMQVNGEHLEVTGELHDGDTVELLFSEEEDDRPSLRELRPASEREALWRQRAKTIAAKEDLRRMADDMSREKLEEGGQFLLAHECGKHLLPFSWLFRSSFLQRELAGRLKQKDFQSLLEQMGAGIVAVDRVAQEYFRVLSDPPSFLFRLLVRCRCIRCPHPLVPGAMVTIDVTLTDRPGVLHAITRCFADRGVNITGTNTYTVAPGVVCDRLGVMVKSSEEFSDLYDALLQVPGVRGVRRVR